MALAIFAKLIFPSMLLQDSTKIIALMTYSHAVLNISVVLCVQDYVKVF